MNTFVSSFNWGMREFTPALLTKPLQTAIIHHFYKPHADPGLRQEEEIALLKSVERYHVDEKGWRAIGYNFVIFPSGRIYECRGWNAAGAHTVGANRESVGIAFAINGDEHPLTPSSIIGCQKLLKEGLNEGWLKNPLQIRGHRDYADKSCPGNLVYPDLELLRPGYPCGDLTQ